MGKMYNGLKYKEVEIVDEKGKRKKRIEWKTKRKFNGKFYKIETKNQFEYFSLDEKKREIKKAEVRKNQLKKKGFLVRTVTTKPIRVLNRGYLNHTEAGGVHLFTRKK